MRTAAKETAITPRARFIYWWLMTVTILAEDQRKIYPVPRLAPFTGIQ
jgi:hypothetical protein